MTNPTNNSGAPLPSERIQEIRNRVSQTTDGPWSQWDEHPEVFCGVSQNMSYAITGDCVARCEADDLGMFDDDAEAEEQAMKNASFIAHSRQDIPDLLAEVSRLSGEVERLRKQGEERTNWFINRFRDELSYEGVADVIVDSVLAKVREQAESSTPSQTSPAPPVKELK